MTEKSALKEQNYLAVRTVIQKLTRENKPKLEQGYSVVSVPVELNSTKRISAKASEVVMRADVAKRVDKGSALALRLRGADAGVRISLHDSEHLILSADAKLQPHEIAFLQLFLIYDVKSQEVVVETNVEVSEDFQGIDLQGYGIGSSLMPKPDFDPRAEVVIPLIKKMYPQAKRLTISTGDIARGKGEHERTGWTTHWLVNAGYTQQGSKFIKVIEL